MKPANDCLPYLVVNHFFRNDKDHSLFRVFAKGRPKKERVISAEVCSGRSVDQKCCTLVSGEQFVWSEGPDSTKQSRLSLTNSRQLDCLV